MRKIKTTCNLGDTGSITQEPATPKLPPVSSLTIKPRGGSERFPINIKNDELPNSYKSNKSLPTIYEGKEYIDKESQLEFSPEISFCAKEAERRHGADGIYNSKSTSYR